MEKFIYQVITPWLLTGQPTKLLIELNLIYEFTCIFIILNMTLCMDFFLCINNMP